MNMLLGVFGEHWFKVYNTKRNISSYPFGRLFKLTEISSCDIEEYITLGIRRCEVCYFILDDIRFPLAPDVSVSCKELKHILDHPQLLKKVIFVRNGEELTSEESEYYFKNYDKSKNH